jgi:DNA polymerase I-like protein with 3'-5' exonuclease and polymerase domains
MIDCFEKGKDVHSLTAFLILATLIGPEKALKANPKKDLAFIGDGKKSWRFWGKKANHSLNYDLSYKAFALVNEIPETDAKLIVEAYHSAYPGVRKNYHRYVQDCIKKSSSLTNLLGRTTTFSDRVEDETFKAGYSCIPQGTVGDIIDSRGMNFIYYNTDPMFERVELLVQVHDMIGFQIPTPYHPTTPVCWKTHSAILNSIKNSLETPLYTHYGLKFVIPVDFNMSLTLNKEEGADIKTITPLELEKAFSKISARRYPMIINS